MFEQSKYDPKYYDEVIENYKLGKKYKIEKWHWSFTKDTKSTETVDMTIDCPTINDFNRELWDLFAGFAKEQTFNIVWGSPISLKERNPERDEVRYYDGLIFYTIRNEFMDCIKNQDISHFMSCIIHYRYFNLKFVVID